MILQSLKKNETLVLPRGPLLRFAFSAEGAASIPGWELRFHVLWGAAKKKKRKSGPLITVGSHLQTQMPMNFNKNSVSGMKVILSLL